MITILKLYENIRQRRLALNLSQEELAQLVGYTSRSSIAKVEKGLVDLSQNKIAQFAKALKTTPAALMGWDESANLSNNDNTSIQKTRKKGVKIPVLGEVIAGLPIEAIEDILDYEEISEDMASKGEYFGLKVKGDSMEPMFFAGDIVIVRQQPTADSGDIVIVLVNGDESTIKKLKLLNDGLMLIPANSAYEPMYYTRKQVIELPVQIIGKVVELRRSF